MATAFVWGCPEVPRWLHTKQHMFTQNSIKHLGLILKIKRWNGNLPKTDMYALNADEISSCIIYKFILNKFYAYFITHKIKSFAFHIENLY